MSKITLKDTRSGKTYELKENKVEEFVDNFDEPNKLILIEEEKEE